MRTLTIELPAHVTQGQMIKLLDAIGCDLRLASDGRNYKAVSRSGTTASNVHVLPARQQPPAPGPQGAA